MPAVQRAEFVPFSARQMFELVNDVEAYPEFLPWCHDARLERRVEDGIVATLSISKGPLHHSFTTQNKNLEFERIEMRLLEGPFKRLYGVWRFDEAPGGCRVSLDLDFEFSNRMLAAALSKVFQKLTSSMVEAFQQRAAALYA
jgi:ribosome-associated toxin RatA of RatAB toxin-antitoxin module